MRTISKAAASGRGRRGRRRAGVTGSDGVGGHRAAALGGCQAFPAYAGRRRAPSAADQSAWNQDVSATPKDPRSADYMKRIRRLGGNQSLHPDFGGDGDYGIPYDDRPGDPARGAR